MKWKLKICFFAGLIAAMVTIMPPAHADFFIRRDKHTSGQADKKQEKEGVFQRLFLSPSQKSKKKQGASSVVLRPSVVTNAVNDQIPYEIGNLQVPRDFNTAMLSAGGPEPKTERDIRIIADIKKHAQLIDLQNRRVERERQRQMRAR